MSDHLTGADLIAVERARQMVGLEEGGEGYSTTHDVGHADELAKAAASYAIPDDYGLGTSALSPSSLYRDFLWPWRMEYYKPTPHDRIRELVKAGALIAAAIDALRVEQGG